MAKIEWVHHRLERWSMWVARGRGAAGAVGRTHPMWAGTPVDGGMPTEAIVPVNDQECWVTEDAIKALPDPLSETIVSYYLQDAIRTRERMRISTSTLSQRIDQAHRLLVDAFKGKPSAEDMKPRSWELPKH